MTNPSGSFSFDLVIFGATGDLSMRKLIPALYSRDQAGQLNDDARLFAVARAQLSNEEFRNQAIEALQKHLPPGEFDQTKAQRFAARLKYLALDADSPDDYRRLCEALDGDDERILVFYLAMAPRFFSSVCRYLGAAGLNRPGARVVLEKPIGHDLASAVAVNQAVGSVFSEERIFRIDHYLGKETVQNLMALRFGNALFEPIWHRGVIDHVQVTVAEKIGVEGRAGYYDHAGALRDMVQNHILQLLCLVAMEPPNAFTADAVRDEKLKILQALAPITERMVEAKTVRGQYVAGAVDGTPVPGYLSEVEGNRSDTETFVVVKAEVESWRWAGVPFYLRTGKRLPQRRSEIVVQFRPVPHLIFPGAARDVVANRLVIRLQPDEGISLHMMAKVPGPGGMRLRQVPLNLSFAEAFHGRQPDAYERLLMDVVRGNPMLFMRGDEVEAAWRWIEPILAGWQTLGDAPKPYTAGSWGPSAAIGLIERDGRTWHEDMH
ncbi:MAG TPA: glucose-6-phosphate dehydrogenase [Ferrovibrio sp.]|uniref:glucose-6-phosphate dehydrogenase n=1 Tax=Ferrovibrio sp. TaxID=1917215 RepID=UPI002B4B577D|nr:glucose-6-phosphate dehydrogenase [Ferrovibrio sp.]HLT77917.1 glucose-6-phosphate dehydrogenase [Ferrovibrio sp.]